jgi:DtxR family Mn-dependent transcriptional regulator
MKIYETSENYLETILMISNGKKHVRSIDIVNELGLSKPTVSVAMKKLREDGLISVDSDGYITLEAEGLEIAEKIYERHVVIADILMYMGVDRKTAFADSCKIEHDISEKSFECMKAYFKDSLDIT